MPARSIIPEILAKLEPIWSCWIDNGITSRGCRTPTLPHDKGQVNVRAITKAVSCVSPRSSIFQEARARAGHQRTGQNPRASRNQQPGVTGRRGQGPRRTDADSRATQHRPFALTGRTRGCDRAAAPRNRSATGPARSTGRNGDGDSHLRSAVMLACVEKLIAERDWGVILSVRAVEQPGEIPGQSTDQSLARRPSVGETWYFEGEFLQSPRYGRQLVAQSGYRKMPTGKLLAATWLSTLPVWGLTAPPGFGTSGASTSPLSFRTRTTSQKSQGSLRRTGPTSRYGLRQP